MTNIGHISLAVEVDGKVCLVILPDKRMRTLLQAAATLSDNGKLNVVEAGPEFKFEQLRRSNDNG